MDFEEKMKNAGISPDILKTTFTATNESEKVTVTLPFGSLLMARSTVQTLIDATNGTPHSLDSKLAECLKDLASACDAATDELAGKLHYMFRVLSAVKLANVDTPKPAQDDVKSAAG